MARKTARQVAMQLIYQYELGGEGVNSTIEETMDKPELNADDLAYIQAMVDGTMDKEEELEEMIGGAHFQSGFGDSAFGAVRDALS